MTFLAARAHAHPAAVLLGVPYDATATFRPGSRLAPGVVRWASQSIETFSPVLRRDLEDVALADAGDLEVEGLAPEAMVDAVAARIGALREAVLPAPPGEGLPVLIGGEHTVALGAVRALLRRHPDLAVVHLDAHTDLREEYEGRRLSHATVMRRVLDLIPKDRIVAAGIRAGTREELALAGTLRSAAPNLALPSPVWTWLQGRPVYVTIDIDAVDPADAPGTGNPEPEGIPAAELLRFVRRLGELRVVGLDLVEVAPPYDPSGRTAVLAATILREAILAITFPTPA